MSLSAYLTSIADAIRAKKGTTDPINAQDFASEIASIEGGGGVSFITSDGLEFNCITSWEECLDANGDVLLDENGAPLMSGKYGSFTVTVKDRLQDINELPAIEDVNNILVYKTPIKSTDTVCLVKSEPRKETIDVTPYSVTETEVTVVDAGGVKMSGVIVMAGHTTVASPITITETNITIYADADGEWVYYNDTWMPFTDVLPSEFDASTYKGMTTDAPTTSSTSGLYLHFNKYYSPREVAITNISEQYVAEGGSITISYVDELSDVTSPVVSQDDLNPVLYITPQKVYTYNGIKYEDWCETVLDSFFKGKTSEFPTKDSADGVYFVRSVTPVSFGIPTTNADIFQNIDGDWKQLSHRRVVDASKFPKPGETGVSGSGASSEKVEVIIGADGGVFTLALLLTMQASMASTTTLVDDHTSVTSPETSTATNVIAYVDNTGVWAYDGESWVDVLNMLFSEGIHYFGVHTSVPDVGLADTWAFAFVSEQTNGSIWMAGGGMCADMTSLLELQLGLRPTSWTVVSDHNEVTSPEAFDMTTMSGPVYVDNSDIWAYVPDNGGWMGLMRDIMGMPEDYAFAILTEPPTADSPMGIYFVPVEISSGGAVVDPNFVPYDEDLIYKVTTKEGETNLYQVYDIGDGTIKVQDERKYNAQFNGTLDFIFVDDHTAVEDPLISKAGNSISYYVDGTGIWYFANPGGWIRKCSSYSIVSEPPTAESAVGYYLVKATESVGIGVADPDVSVHQMVCGDPWASVNFGGTIFDFIYIMSAFKDTTATSYKIVNDISEVTDTNFVYLIKNTQSIAYIDVNGNLDHITPAFAAEQGYTYEVVSKRSEAVAVPNKLGYYACFGELDWKDLTGTITTLEGQVEELGEQVTTLETEVDGLETENNNLETRVNNLTAEKTTLTTKVNNLTAEKANLTTEKANLTTQVNTLTSEKANLTQQVNTLTTENTNLETQIDTLESEKADLQSDLDATVPSMNFMNYAVLSGSEDGVVLTDVTDTSITSIKIHNSVASISSEAFEHCASLTSIEIPDSVTSINSYAFDTCYNLTYILVDEKNPIYQSIDGNVYTKDGKTLLHYAIGKWATSFIIPDSVTSIGTYAFCSCGTLTSITIPDSVTSISNAAFRWCRGLRSIVIPDGVTSIKKSTFEGCRMLASITIPNNVTSIDAYAFYSCASLTSVYYKGTVEDWNAITIDFGNDYLVDATHYYYSETEPPLNAEGTAYDGNYWYYDENGEINVWDKEELNSQGLAYALNDDGVSYSVTGIGECVDTNMFIPSAYEGLPITTIRSRAFHNCDSLTSVVIGDSVETIGDYAFYGCSLTNVVIPDSVTTIDDGAFFCSGLMSVVIPDSVETIGSMAFDSCGYLTSITVSGGNANYKSIDGNLYTKDGKTLIQYAIGKTATKFTIPDSVTSIGIYAFNAGINLTSITIPDSVTTIGGSAFSGCKKLTSINIPDSVTSIGGLAFWACFGLTSITIPDSVTTINGGAFQACSKLTSIIFQGTMEQWNAITKGSNWNKDTGNYTIHCTDGDIAKES